jgi:hypothetical protein
MEDILAPADVPPMMKPLERSALSLSGFTDI